MLPGKVGRRPADRRVPVRRPGSPYFRTLGDGVIVARPAAIEPTGSFGRTLARAPRAAFGQRQRAQDPRGDPGPTERPRRGGAVSQNGVTARADKAPASEC